MPRVGVFGGSFNPIHFGHLLVADEIVEALDLDRLLLVPAALPPHKPGGDLAPARARFEMTALAVREHERFEVCDLELRRPGLSYTVDTLKALRWRHFAKFKSSVTMSGYRSQPVRLCRP